MPDFRSNIPIEPKLLHLFVNDFDGLLFGTQSSKTDFLTKCRNKCINFLSFYDIQSILPSNGTTLSNFISDAKTNYGICDVSGSIPLSNNGVDSRAIEIKNYNQGRTADKQFTWLTLENEWWNQTSAEFETFLTRLKTLRPYAYQNNLKLEAYLGRKGNSSTFNNAFYRMAPFLDRILLENEANVAEYTTYNRYIGTPTSTASRTRQILLAATAFRSGNVTVFGNVINGDSGTNFINDIGVGSSITVGDQRFTIQQVLGTHQAIATTNASPNITTPTKYRTYVHIAPILYMNLSNVWSYMQTPANIKSYNDVYKLHTLSNYSIGTAVQKGVSPICYQDEYNPGITGSTFVDGISIYARLDPTPSAPDYSFTSAVNVKNPTAPCNNCNTASSFILGTISTSNTTCDNTHNGVISISFNSNGLTAPFTGNFIGPNNTIQVINTSSLIVFSGCESGTWSVFVSDSTGAMSDTVNGLIIDETFNPTIISNGSGSISVLLSGGTAPYYIIENTTSFFKTPISGDTYVYSGFAPGSTYTFTVGDHDSCWENIDITITSGSTNLGVTVSTINPTCDSALNGVITATINSPSISPYTYIFNNGVNNYILNSSQPSYIFNGANSGNWTVKVLDSTTPTQLSSTTINTTLVSTFHANISSIGNSNVCFYLTGGTLPYYIFDTNNTFFQTVFNHGINCFDINCGTYAFTVGDDNSCNTLLSPVTIPCGGVNLSLLSSTNAGCIGICNGTLNVRATNGTLPYSYSATNGVLTVVNTTGSFTGLCTGNWTVKSKDINGLNSNSLTKTIFSNFFATAYTNNGLICVYASGSPVNNYTLIIGGSNYSYSGLTTRCYTATTCGHIGVTLSGSPSGSCSYHTSLLLDCNFNILLSGTPTSCPESSDGSIIIWSSGGTAPYSYTAYNGTYTFISNTTPTYFNNLINGTWLINAKDGLGHIDSRSINLDPTLTWRHTITSSGASSNICIDVSGGTQPYFININDIIYTGLSAGTYCYVKPCDNYYEISVTDKNNCSTYIIDLLYINCISGHSLDYTSLNSFCSDDNGLIHLNPTGGTPPYTYIVSNGTIIYSGTSANFIVPVGHWIGSVIDDNGVIFRTTDINITKNFQPTITPIFNNAIITFSGAEVTYVIIDGITLGGYNSGTYVFNLSCGMYHDITVRGLTNIDAVPPTECLVTSNLYIPCSNLIWNNNIIINPSCYNSTDGSITLNISGGSPSYTYTISSINETFTYIGSGTTHTFNGLSATTWTATIVDNNGNSITQTIVLVSNYIVTVNPNIDAYTVTISGGTAPYSLFLDGILINSQLNNGTYTYSAVCGLHIIEVTEPFGHGGNTIIVNDPMIQNSSFNTNTNWIVNIIGGNISSYTMGSGSFSFSALTAYTNPGGPTTGPIFYQSYSGFPENPCSITYYYSVTTGGGDWASCHYSNILFQDPYGGYCYVEGCNAPPLNLQPNTTYIGFFTNINPTVLSSSLMTVGMSWSPYGDDQGTFMELLDVELTLVSYTTCSCPYIFNIEISCSTPTLVVNSTNPTCGVNNNGTITTSATGGIPPYTYTITDGNISKTNNTGIFSNLINGTYTVTVVDSSLVPTPVSTSVILNGLFYILTSSTINNFCVEIIGGLPPYTIYVDGVLTTSATTETINCYTASCATNHIIVVTDSSTPSSIILNQSMLQNGSFDTNNNWIINAGLAGNIKGYDIGNGAFSFTALTAYTNPGGPIIGGGITEVTPRFPDHPCSITYNWSFTTGRGNWNNANYVYLQIFDPYGPNGLDGLGVILRNSLFDSLLNNTTYSGTITYTPLFFIEPLTGFTFNMLYSPYGDQLDTFLELLDVSFMIANYTECPCEVSGNTTTICPPTLGLMLISYINPGCIGDNDGKIIVSGYNGTNPYTYSATSGSTTYINSTGIFTGLTAGIWYLSVMDSIGSIATLISPITLNNTFYGYVTSYSNGYCVTISGGTQPYFVDNNGISLIWNYNNITNCYPSISGCGITTIITIKDSA